MAFARPCIMCQGYLLRSDDMRVFLWCSSGLWSQYLQCRRRRLVDNVVVFLTTWPSRHWSKVNQCVAEQAIPCAYRSCGPDGAAPPCARCCAAVFWINWVLQEVPWGWQFPPCPAQVGEVCEDHLAQQENAVLIHQLLVCGV